MMNRMLRGLFFCLIILITLAAKSHAQEKREKVTVAISGETMVYFPLYVARGAGFFEEQKIELDWVNVGAASRQAAAVLGGGADMTPIGLFHTVKAKTEGAELVAFSGLMDVYVVQIVLSNQTLSKTGITQNMTLDEKVKRLNGLNLAISSPGSTTDMFIRKLLLARGYDPEKTVKLRPMGGTAQVLAAFDKNLTDGFVYTAPIVEMVLSKGTGKIVIDGVKGEVPELKDVPYMSMITSASKLKARPETFLAVTRALAKAMKFAHEQPEETRKVVRRYFPELEDPVFDLMFEAYRLASAKSPLITPAMVAKTVEWMNIGSPTKVEGAYDAIVASEPARAVAIEFGLPR